MKARLEKPAHADGGDGGARARHGNDWHAPLHRAANEHRTRIAHGWRSRVGDERERLAPSEPLHDGIRAACLVVRGQRMERLLLDAEVLEKLTAVPRVLRHHAVARREHFARAVGHVLQVSDRRRDDVERHGGERIQQPRG